MINNYRILLILIQILSFLDLSHSFSQNAVLVSDLEKNSTADFTLEANEWTLSSAVCSSCSKLYKIPANTCGASQQTILGGPNILGPQGSSADNQYFERTYSGVTAAQSFKGFQFDIWIFSKEVLSNPASWTDSFVITINGNTAGTSSLELLESCQIDYVDSDGVVIKAFYKYRYQTFVIFMTSTAVLRVTQYGPSPTKLNSFGFKNVKIFFLNSPSYWPIKPANFPCDSRKFWDGSSTTCSSCTEDCITCTGPGARDCIACLTYLYQHTGTCSIKICSGPFTLVKSKGNDICVQRCPTNFYWRYGSGSCRDDCSFPLQPDIDKNGFDTCVNPCAGKKYIYPDGSCSDSCTSPQFSIRDSIFCVSPCESTTNSSFLNGTCASACNSPLLELTSQGITTCQSPCPTQYIYANNSCSKNCLSPLMKKDESDIKFCVNPCIDPTNEYLFSDKTCKLECPSPLLSRSEDGTKYCWNPCTTYALPYLYPNSTCKSACKSPLKSRTESGVSYCENPCPDPENDFLYLDGTCKECPLPLKSRSEPGVKYCWNPCTSSFAPYLYPDSTCKTGCNSPLKLRTESEVKYCENPCPDPVNDFLYLDGTCKECSPPLLSRTESGVKYCSNPCTSSSAPYLYPNSTCKAACKSPLKSKTESGVVYCYNPCSDPVNDFLYVDGTCKLECPSPFVPKSEPGINYCGNPCTSQTPYLYPNLTCKAACNSPLKLRTESGVKYCENPCTDPANEFLYLDGICKLECPSPLLSRSEDVAKYCWNPCTSSLNPFLYPNSTCKAVCKFPLKSRTEFGVNYCWSPCDFNTEYLFDNGNCSEQCHPPLRVRIEPNFVRYCHNPCYANNTFLYPNGSCLSHCKEPLKEETENGMKSCFNPCPNSNDYLYLDKSCSVQCPFPLSNRVESVAKYCFPPCDDSSEFLYNNGSCLPACNAPYIKSQSFSVNQCSGPCPDSQKEYFNEADQTCKSACVSPYESKIFDGVKTCVLTHKTDPDEEAETTKSTVSLVVSQSQATQVGLQATSSFNSANPALALLAAQASMLFYIRYIDLNYTAKLKLFFLLQDASPFSFTLGIDIPEALEEKLRDRELPKVFEEYDLHSNYLFNSWDMLTSLLLAFLLILLVSVMKLFTGRWRRIDRVVGGVLAVLKWNIPLTIVCGGFGDIYFYASFQLQSTSFGSISDMLCFALSIVMMFIGMGILVITVKMVKDLMQKSQESDDKWQNFELLYESYERTSFTTFGYMAMFLARTIIFNLIIANLYRYPLTQSILINILTILMFGYLVIKRPLKSVLELVQLFLNEIFLIIVNICVLIIAIMDQAGIRGQELRNGVCETIMKIIIIFSTTALAFVALQILISLYLFYKLLKRLKSEGRLNISGILNAWLDGGEGQEMKKPENHEGKKNLEIIPTTNLGRRCYEKVNRNTSQLSLFDFQTEEKMASNATIQPLEIKGETVNPSHSDILDNSLISEAPILNTIPRPKPGSGEALKNNSLFEMSQLMMESSNGESRVITIDPLDLVVNKKKNLSLEQMVHQEQERRSYLRKFGIVNFRDGFWKNQEK